MITKIQNGRIIIGDTILEGLSLYLKDGKIMDITSQNHMYDTIIDAKGHYIAPGFIDIHTHGGGGADFMDATTAAYHTACLLHAKHGTTALLPTILSGSEEEMYASFAVFKEAKSKPYHGAQMLGLHLEGPYFAMSQRGAQDPAYIRPPVREEYNQMLKASDDILCWSAAPELEGALLFGMDLAKHGILPAIGHSDADFDQVVAAYEKGFTHVTHLYSATSTVHRKNAFRYAGIVEAAYLIDGMTVEIIADGIHLPPPLLKFVYRFKGPEHTALITDSMRGAGMPSGESILGSLKTGQKVVVEDGVAKLPDRTAFAGSVATMDRLVRNMIQLADVPLTDAVLMATETPAAILRLSNKGRLAIGYDADLVIFDDNITIQYTIVNGKIIYAF